MYCCIPKALYSPQPPPVCSIHLDDATAATGQRRQCAHHTPATGGEERESLSQSRGWGLLVDGPIKWMRMLRQEVSTTEVRPLSKAPNPQLLPRQCRLPTAPLGWVKCREHISLLIILRIIVYVTNKAHLSLICICCIRRP